MIGVLQEDYSLVGGVESVTKRLLEGFYTERKEIRLYSCKEKYPTKKNENNVKVLKIYSFSQKEIKYFINTLIEDGVSKLIVQLNGPYSIMAKKLLFKKLYEVSIDTYIVIHNSPKSFITFYRNFADSFFISFLKKMRMFIYLRKKVKSFFSYVKNYVKFVTISQGNYNELKKYYNIESIVIPNVYNPNKKKKTKNKIHSLAYIGRFDFCQKNIFFLLDAWNYVKDKCDWIFTILGDDDEYSTNRIKSYINKKNIYNVIVRGVLKKEEIEDFLAQNSILLLGSNYEGFPTVVLEAASNDNVVVSTRYDGFSDEILKNNINGFIVDFNITKYAEAIQKLISDDQLIDEFSKNSSSIIHEYLLQNPIKKWLSILDK